MNAEIASALVDADTMLGILLTIQGSGGGGDEDGGGDSTDSLVMSICEDLQEKVPETLDWNDIAERNIQDNSPLKVAEAPWSVAEWAVALRFDNPRATVLVLVLGWQFWSSKHRKRF